MTISKFSAASVTATLFVAAFSTSTMAADLGSDVVSATTTVTFAKPGVSGHQLVKQEYLQLSIANNDLVATGSVTTVADGVVGLQWTTGNYISGRDYSWRSIQRTGGSADETLRVFATSLTGTELSGGNTANGTLRITANSAGSAGYLLKFSNSSGKTLVAGDYVIGMNAATYIP